MVKVHFVCSVFVVGRMGVLYTLGEVRGELCHRFPPPIVWVPGTKVRFSGVTEELHRLSGSDSVFSN